MIHRYGLRTTDHGRTAFTLIELLVVISIIIMLAGLLLAAVMRVFITVDEARVANEVSQLNLAVESFKNTHGFYPPSKITIAGDAASSDTQAQMAIKRMFPRIDWNNMDWNGDGSPDAGATTLNGAQCLVFFLGGPGGQGFSTNPTNPTATGGDRIPPFNFQPNRLGGAGFPAYQDIYGNPYIYFSSYNRPNGYIGTDCPQLGGGPYTVSAGKYANPNSFQIISAGRNGLYPATGSSQLGSLPKDGLDNLTNFNKGTLQTY